MFPRPFSQPAAGRRWRRRCGADAAAGRRGDRKSADLVRALFRQSLASSSIKSQPAMYTAANAGSMKIKALSSMCQHFSVPRSAGNAINRAIRGFVSSFLTWVDASGSV
jgi:hypothetical protein